MSSETFDLSDLVESLSAESDNKIRKQLVNTYLEKVYRISKTSVNDFRKGLEWMNVKEPLSLKNHLKGKLVILDFFTYCCINCMHILPDLKAIEHQFSVEDGLVVVGVHSPKFSNEKETENIAAAVERYEITHPVVNDPDESMWRALGVCCWPTLIVIGPKGDVILELTGEGHRELLEVFLGEAIPFFKKKGEISTHSLPQIQVNHYTPAAHTLLYPGKVTVAHGKMAIADTGHHRIIIADLSGKVQHVIGGPESGLSDGKLTDARFHSVQGIVFRSPSVLYVADTENHAIREIDLTSGQVKTVAGTGKQGHDRQGGKLQSDQEISSPWDLCIVNDNILLIAMAGTHQIWALFLEDTVWWKNRKYRKGECSAVAGSGREENRNNTYPSSAAFAQPSGLSVAPELDCIFIADSESSAVRMLQITNGQVSGVAGGVIDPRNLFAFGDLDGKGTDAKLQHPLGVAWSRSMQTLYVADSYNHKVKCITPTTKECTTLKDGTSKPIKLSEPGGLCADGDNLYVADTNNHQIILIDLNTKKASKVPIQLPSSDDEKDSNKKLPVVCEKSVTVLPKGGVLVIRANVELPVGTLLTTGAPSKWKIVLPAGSRWSVVNDENSVKKFQTTAEWTINIVPSELLEDSKSYIIIDCVVFLCAGDTCTSQSVAFKVNVSHSSSATESKVTCDIKHQLS